MRWLIGLVWFLLLEIFILIVQQHKKRGKIQNKNKILLMHIYFRFIHKFPDSSRTRMTYLPSSASSCRRPPTTTARRPCSSPTNPLFHWTITQTTSDRHRNLLFRRLPPVAYHLLAVAKPLVCLQPAVIAPANRQALAAVVESVHYRRAVAQLAAVLITAVSITTKKGPCSLTVACNRRLKSRASACLKTWVLPRPASLERWMSMRSLIKCEKLWIAQRFTRTFCGA